MGNVFASCGHRLKPDGVLGLKPVTLRTLTREGKRAVSYSVLCPRCLKRATDKGCLIASNDERDKWLAGIEGGNVW